MSKSKNQVRQFQKNVQAAGKKVDHIGQIVDGFNFMVEKKAVVIDLPAVYLFRELLGSEESKQKAWQKNAYLYARMKLGHTEGVKLVFMDIETKERIGAFDGKSFFD